ncbi:hypothetical protein JNW90_13320 [Micromonospora sp. STR1s_5]|nr:hypothetical protein [Micromonospora sp. STR1s_5]
MSEVFRLIVVFEDEDESSEFHGGATLKEARASLCLIVRRELKARRKVQEADIYDGDHHRMNIPVGYLIDNNEWENWCGECTPLT